MNSAHPHSTEASTGARYCRLAIPVCWVWACPRRRVRFAGDAASFTEAEIGNPCLYPAAQPSRYVRHEAGVPAEIRGEFKPIVTRLPGLTICEHLPAPRRPRRQVRPGGAFPTARLTIRWPRTTPDRLPPTWPKGLASRNDGGRIAPETLRAHSLHPLRRSR